MSSEPGTQITFPGYTAILLPVPKVQSFQELLVNE